MKTLRFALAPLLTLGLLAGCATTGGGGAATDQYATVRVDNNLIPASSVTVWLIAESGYRHMLGRISPNNVKDIAARGASALGEYRLIAERTGDRDVVSRTFYLTRATHTVRWDLDTNTITLLDN